MTRKFADVDIQLQVSFYDNGDDDLNDQAIEAAAEALSVISFNFIPQVVGIEVVGVVRDTKFPARPAAISLEQGETE